MLKSLCLLFLSFAKAEIPFANIDGIEEFIDEEYEELNPEYGYVALETDLIKGIRRHGNYIFDTTGFPIKDQPQDFVTRLVHTLFPSPTGDLASETNAHLNIGRLLTERNKVQGDAASLVGTWLVLAHTVRKYCENTAKIEDVEKIAKKCFQELRTLRRRDDSLKEKMIKNAFGRLQDAQKN